MQVTVTCNRCKNIIEGLMEEEGTSGFYDVSKDESPFKKYANPGEQIVCDACMFSDPRYIAVYGRRG